MHYNEITSSFSWNLLPILFIKKIYPILRPKLGLQLRIIIKDRMVTHFFSLLYMAPFLYLLANIFSLSNLKALPCRIFFGHRIIFSTSHIQPKQEEQEEEKALLTWAQNACQISFCVCATKRSLCLSALITVMPYWCRILNGNVAVIMILYVHSCTTHIIEAGTRCERFRMSFSV